MVIHLKSWRLGFGLMALSIVLFGPAAEFCAAAAHLEVYDTRYYQLYTDLAPAEARQVAVRMTAMVQEYARRTAGFSGAVREKLPFYLFRNHEDYLAAGGMEGSSGVYTGRKLMATAGEKLTRGTWAVIQHEGFHQFAHKAIGGERPVWVNEGLADYFGESLYTGEGFVSGIAPPWRIARVQKRMREGEFRSVIGMMNFSHAAWNANISGVNYDQAWSMVYFLAHGAHGKFQKAFEQFILLCGRGQPVKQAWDATFGDPTGFEAQWRDYWMSMPLDASDPLYLQVSATIYTQLLGKMLASGATMPTTIEALVDWATQDAAKNEDDYLVPSLLSEAQTPASKGIEWTFEQAGTLGKLVGSLKDGVIATGTVSVRGNRVVRTTVELDDLARILSQAEKLAEQGNKREAAALLREGLQRLPKSPLAVKARQLLQTLR